MFEYWRDQPEYDLSYCMSTANPMGLEVREMAASGMQFVGDLMRRAGDSFQRSLAVVSVQAGEPTEESVVYHLDVSTAEPNWCWWVDQERKKREEL